MATIEPRLIHLLNESTTPQLSNADLPPLHSLPLPESPDRPLPPLDRAGADRAGRNGPTSLAASVPHAGDESAYASYRKDEDRRDGRYIGGIGSYQLRLLLGDGDATTEQSHPFVNILDDGQDSFDDGSTKKRGRAINVKEDFVQLPQPVKKQKAAQQAPVMPPIINGLLEPPPHAALFPPIASNSFDENDTNQMKLLAEFNHGPEEKTGYRLSPEPEKSANKARKRAVKPRRKWTEEETNNLLLGVDRHGVGKWTSILEDTDFKFNGRTAGDLKDRFRTCCPEEMRGIKRFARQDSAPSSKQKAKKGIYSENILIEEEVPSAKEPEALLQNESDSAPKKKSRAHRMKMEDLAGLGIRAPFKKSLRRERHPFTEQDDREILEGLECYGPAWTKIQRDARFHLSGRQPTDLRDRVRNKYPAIYQRIEKGTFQTKDAPNDILEPSIDMSIDNSFSSRVASLDPPMSHMNFREDLPRWPFQMADLTDYSQPTQGFEFGDPSAPQMMGGEMDISRLLLDDSKLTPTPTRPGADEASSTSPSGTTYNSRKDRHDGHRRK